MAPKVNKKTTVKGSSGHDYEVSLVADIILTYLKAQNGDKEAKKKFEAEFVNGNPEMEVMIDVVLRANDLVLKDLIDIFCEKIADRMKSKSVAWVRKAFAINQFPTAAEEAGIMKQYPWAFEGVDADED
ncbi:hypothetical protein CASFOL_012456 [Castilleja foliolosa]|uniref:SKP1 component dimerisation domain-containing protein n=1 Tax=Castilleja foliolosa TaxID=1961234 RepID=A0ABD3DIZ6_9LAMI